ncbi:MAG: glycosyltransferase family 4 protein, partial [Treponema sp.]|jgi:glycosyltransferase involved in cell wall biosynthesis|nr:glycosyltransferase family 4 protein [Treponema sp.]
MTILGVFLINEIRTGGDRRYLELLESLAERGNRVFVIMNTFLNYAPKHLTQIKLTVKYTRHRFPPASFLFRENIKRRLSFIKNELEYPQKIDFIHIHGDIYLKSAIFLKKALQVPLFYASRCNDVDRARILRAKGALPPKEYLFSLVYEQVNLSRERQIARFADLTTFQNAPDRDIFVKRTGYRAEKTVVIPGNIGLPRCTPEWKDKNDSKSVQTMVYIGSLSPSKGLFDLLKALKELKKRGITSLRCCVLGRAENVDQTERLIEGLDIKEMVALEGFQDPFPYLARCDVMVYPSLYDAYPDTALEALHTGCPTLGSRAGGLTDLLKYPELLFETGNIREIADRIERCIKEPEFYQRIRRLCAERAEAHRFDWTARFEEAMKRYGVLLCHSL